MSTLEPETINKVTWQIPNALCLIGSRAGDEWNGMTQSWVSQVAMSPVLIAISVDATAVTNRLIRDGGSFSVNLWDQADTRIFVKFSKPAVKDGDSLNGRQIRVGATGVPIFVEAVAFLEKLLTPPVSFAFRVCLGPGEGIVCNNVLHNREGFSDDADTSRQRLLWRARYRERITGTARWRDQAPSS